MIILEKLVQCTGQVKGNGQDVMYTLRGNVVKFRLCLMACKQQIKRGNNFTAPMFNEQIFVFQDIAMDSRHLAAEPS